MASFLISTGGTNFCPAASRLPDLSAIFPPVFCKKFPARFMGGTLFFYVDGIFPAGSSLEVVIVGMANGFTFTGSTTE
jgi:hypothetical protein